MEHIKHMSFRVGVPWEKSGRGRGNLTATQRAQPLRDPCWVNSLLQLRSHYRAWSSSAVQLRAELNAEVEEEEEVVLSPSLCSGSCSLCRRPPCPACSIPFNQSVFWVPVCCSRRTRERNDLCIWHIICKWTLLCIKGYPISKNDLGFNTTDAIPCS